MTPARNTAHATQAKELLTSMFVGRPVVTGLVEAYANRLQTLENQLWDIILKRNLVDGFGVILDILGKIVGEKRKGRTDAAYRLALGVRILINRSTGRIPEILRIIDAIAHYTADTVNWSYADAPPAGFVVTLETDNEDAFPALLDAMRQVHPNGVEVSALYGPLTTLPAADGYLVPSSLAGPVARARGAGTATDNTPSATAMHVERI